MDGGVVAFEAPADADADTGADTGAGAGGFACESSGLGLL